MSLLLLLQLPPIEAKDKPSCPVRALLGRLVMMMVQVKMKRKKEKKKKGTLQVQAQLSTM